MNNNLIGVGCAASATRGDIIVVSDAHRFHTKNVKATNSGGNTSGTLKIER
jgi:hypothetical protein